MDEVQANCQEDGTYKGVMLRTVNEIQVISTYMEANGLTTRFFIWTNPEEELYCTLQTAFLTNLDAGGKVMIDIIFDTLRRTGEE